MWLPQYGIPAVVARAYARARGRRPGGYIDAAERVAAGERVDGPALVAAGNLAGMVWSVVGFASIVALIATAILVGRHLTRGTWPSRVVANVFPAILAVALGTMVVINFRLRAASRSLARGDSTPSALATPKGRDAVVALALAAALVAVGIGATGGVG